MTEPKSNREQLAERVADGGDDLASLSAAVLVDEVLPALDEIRTRTLHWNFLFGFHLRAVIEITAIYDLLLDLVPFHKQAEINHNKLQFMTHLEKLKRQEKKGGSRD
jgi:hypothetical protein